MDRSRGCRLTRLSVWRDLGLATITAFVLLTLLPAASPAQAATVTVTSLADSGGSCPSANSCTLRDALAAALPGDTIQFNVAGAILLSSTLTVAKNVTINGPGAGNLTVDGQGTVRVVQVNSGVQAAFVGITIQNGQTAGDGGGISNSGGSVTLTGTTLSGNSANGNGAGIFNAAGGTVTVTNSTLSGSLSAYGSGGGIYNNGGIVAITGSTLSTNSAVTGGGIGNAGTVTLLNSTLSGNFASTGGGISNSSGTLTLTNSTMSGNTAITGGGFSTAGGTVHMRNSIVVNSGSGGNCTGAPIISLGNNLSDTPICFPGGPMGNIVTATPQLGPLTLNAPGTTATHLLLSNSLAIDGVTFNPTDCPGTIATDQRGVVRPQIVSAARCDIGAFELEGNSQPTISTLSDQTTAEDVPTSTISFSVGDAETAAASLVVTATSGNQTLAPNSGIQLTGSGTSRAIRLTPATNQSGTSLITVAVSDGTETTHTTFTLTVTAVNDLPVAVNDSYSVGATQTLTPPGGAGVLANDTDVETTSLQAQLVSGPAHGTLTLQPAGGFSYTPVQTFAGTDSFTYRASDGSGQSAPATVTITVVAAPCAPRASVKVTTAVGDGKLQATVEALPLASQTNNRLQEVRFGAFQNGRVTLNGQSVASGQTYTAPASTTQVSFTVERVTPGQATTISLTAVDACGSWPSFVGGGPGAGF